MQRPHEPVTGQCSHRTCGTSIKNRDIKEFLTFSSFATALLDMNDNCATGIKATAPHVILDCENKIRIRIGCNCTDSNCVAIVRYGILLLLHRWIGVLELEHEILAATTIVSLIKSKGEDNLILGSKLRDAIRHTETFPRLHF